ncbi:hypothetical protein B0H10DRAFT_1115931 [Mycena sp. CBHHK59/15]|nr:hypothetical protein B0H10DRAFT_1115931 [Mycena sp. CBHHK59/15]
MISIKLLSGTATGRNSGLPKSRQLDFIPPAFRVTFPFTRNRMFFARFIVLVSTLVLASVVNSLPVISRAVALNVAKCTSPATKLVTHDCNVALLGLGGGIAGAIEFLRVNAASTTAVSGTCRVTATAVNGAARQEQRLILAKVVWRVMVRRTAVSTISSLHAVHLRAP